MKASQRDQRQIDRELALPRGFHDLEEESLERERMLLECFARRGRQIGCTLLRTSPIGYAATLQRGSSAAGDRVFRFLDRRERELMLTPDSTPAVLRWYLAGGSVGPVRVAFRSPLFRYRRQKYRHFQQLGFTFINEPPDRPGELDETSLQLARAALRVFVRDLGVSLTLNVIDFGAWRRCLSQIGLGEDRASELLNNLRPLGPDERTQWIKGKLNTSESRQLLLSLSAYRVPAEGTTSEGRLGDLVRNAMQFARESVAGLGARAYINFADLHSSELQDGIGFSFVTSDGERFADGGCYGLYGRRFDSRVRTLKSFASGVEFFLQRNLLARARVQPRKVLILELDAARSFSRAIADSLLEAGVTVVCRRLEGKLRSFLQRQDDTFSWLIVVGRAEEDSGVLSIRHMQGGEISRVLRQDLPEWAHRCIQANVVSTHFPTAKIDLRANGSHREP